MGQLLSVPMILADGGAAYAALQLNQQLENAVIVAIEKFGFGMGSVGHMLYMMQQIAPGPFRMAHYAMATGVMALTKWGTGTVSGALWSAVDHHYVGFFGWVLVFSIPPVVLAWLAPFPQDHEKAAEVQGEPAVVGGH